ncbi:hypothetical protein OR1_01937 [Geobacter sp. OR-1]|uniref:motility associated factor glycosyltransferase family protein n=1 Tax=Geobacter sp. OR-1 TaxID=1266765 RepID=UPI0005423F37|nr:6-hydroxymethylpterin diphosphokinase MptE-like protein [Geobacter sp. OR-1]GAM09657.1 hypothetical protein OR1_01937 [Geobacter sp. OR-1]
MILTDNLKLLKTLNPNLHAFMKAVGETLGESDVILSHARNGEQTLQVRKGNSYISLHSGYDPRREAEAFIGTISEEEVENYNHVFFYGVGLGYHIEAFLKRFPNVFVTLFEPNKQVFYRFLSRFKMDTIPRRYLKGIYVADKTEDLEGFAVDFMNRFNDSYLFVTLPAYERAFSEEFSRFKSYFTDSIRLIRANRATILTFEKRWTINSMMNFIPTLTDTDVFTLDGAKFARKPAILVAAGPSLEDELESLRKIRDEGTAYIFTVGSAIKALVNAGIKPHAAVSMDPDVVTQYTFAEIVEKGITDIPFIYGTSVGFEAVRDYPGPKLYMTMDRDTISPYFTRYTNGVPRHMVNDAPTIAITTLQLLAKLGFDPIILVGQNLGFRGNQYYAKGISYDAEEFKTDHMAPEQQLASAEEIEDVYGGKILASSQLIIFRKSMENLIAAIGSSRRVINTTRGGAAIAGTSFMHLDELMSQELMTKVVSDTWTEPHSGTLDLKYLEKQKEKMNASRERLRKYLDHAEKIAIRLSEVFTYRKVREIEPLLQDLDKTFQLIIKNDFFKMFLSPLNAMESLVFSNYLAYIRSTTEIGERARRVARGFGSFIIECKRDIAFITDQLYPLVCQAIDERVQADATDAPAATEVLNMTEACNAER